MKRLDLEKRCIKELESQEWECERAYNRAVFIPKRGYIAKRFDFFHVIDIIAVKGSQVRFIQVTSADANPNSKSNRKNGSHALEDHQRKIEKIWKHDIPIEIWLYEKVKRRWNLPTHTYQRPHWITQGGMNPSIQEPNSRIVLKLNENISKNKCPIPRGLGQKRR